MAEAFAAAFEDCGFKRAESLENLGLDSFFVDGADVLYRWQNNSEAETFSKTFNVISPYFFTIQIIV